MLVTLTDEAEELLRSTVAYRCVVVTLAWVAEPLTDRDDVDAGSEQVDSRAVPHAVGMEALGARWGGPKLMERGSSDPDSPFSGAARWSLQEPSVRQRWAAPLRSQSIVRAIRKPTEERLLRPVL